MRRRQRLLRFFWLVPPAHPIARIGLALTAGVGSALVGLGITPASALLVPLVLLQSLATSSGFALTARRGHYDLLFTLGYSRLQVALSQWAASAVAGLGAWLVLGAVEAMVWQSTPSLMTTGSVAVMTFASTVPWALTVRLPRLSGGIALIVSATFVWAVLPAPARGAVVNQFTAIGLLEWAAATAASGALLAESLRMVVRMDVPLESAQ